MPRAPYVYVATGKSRDVSRNAPEGARLAFHNPGRDTVELHISPNGAWQVQVGPEPGGSGRFVTVATGQTVAFVDQPQPHQEV